MYSGATPRDTAANVFTRIPAGCIAATNVPRAAASTQPSAVEMPAAVQWARTGECSRQSACSAKIERSVSLSPVTSNSDELPLINGRTDEKRHTPHSTVPISPWSPRVRGRAVTPSAGARKMATVLRVASRPCHCLTILTILLLPRSPLCLQDTPVEYDKETDPEGYWKVFQEFDEDGSGAVDVKEMKTMVEGLGMALTDAELKDYIKRADADESGEIEFEEFVQVLKAATAEGAMAAGGESFATLIRRKANSQSMKWREDRKSSKVTVDAASGTASFASEEGNGVVLLDQWIPGDNRCARHAEPNEQGI